MACSTKQDMNIHLVPKAISFSMFTSEQMKKLAVTKIVSPLMLDSLGHPLPGGLYDTRLGPISDKGDPCGTCWKTLTNCPGHFGYIELPIPVVNPMFYKIIGSILRISCSSCHLIQLPIHVKSCLRIQLKLLNAGLVTLALEVENRIMELIHKYKSYASIPNEELDCIVGYERTAEDMSAELDEINILNQNTETLHNQFVNNILKNFKQENLCMYCKKAINKIQALKNKFIMSVRKFDTENSNAGKGARRRVVATESQFINAHECRQMIRDVWQVEKDFVEQLAPVLKDVDAEFPTDVFFFDVLPVPPSNVRPVNIVQGRIIENKQTISYKNILQNIILLKTIIQVVQKKGDESTLILPEAKAAYTFAQGNTPTEKLHNAWEELQKDVNGIVDRESKRNTEGEGLKQIIEKKEGIIRMNMMGKRVNYSARSVITPDPNLNIDEIGIPEEFAKKLTYPVPVTPWNVEELRKMILNGPNVHPGAVMVEHNGVVTRINPNNARQQGSLLKCLLTPDDRERGSSSIKIVHRHLCNGDVLLLNRQPTLHKPSIMAHTARILKGEKTLRLHYANCKAYNADFDGDEMNVHMPQNELARSEGYHIVNVDNQYLVPKDGTPLSGLIQDYMIAGVRMAIRGRFFSRDDYQQFVFQALSYMKSEIVLLPPAIIKPKLLWSGKQILSTVIINIIPKGRALINLTATSKISAKAWQTDRPREWAAGGTPFSNPNAMTETEVIIRRGELLVGILEKSHYGPTPYGLVHCIYELYGGIYATRILSSFAKMFMRFLQQEGFTLGVRDIWTVPKADAKRRKIIAKSRKIGGEVVAAVLKLPEDTPPETLVEEIEKAEAMNPKIRMLIDRQYKTVLDSYTNRINKACLPAGLICKFPENNLQLMVQSGAKGSTVNTMQISCLLGQIELEGKRPPVMISGKSLPSFPAFEFAPRAGGFIDGRFMSGIQPQEFFFHCMAGREGLIDTAVKTSRSGYLQRCLIKHLEGLHIAYDMTVRNSDQSVIQFKYGEDGLDVCKAQFLNEKQLNFLKENDKAISQRDLIKQLKKTEEYKEIKAYQGAIKKWKSVLGDPLTKNRDSPYTVFERIVKAKLKDKFAGKQFTKEMLQMLWYEVDAEVRKECTEKCIPCPDPVDCVFQPDCHYGSINERLQQMLESYNVPKKKKFEEMMKLKIMQSMVVPGEPVGLLAAQSIGEPSTQMTLNTFHFAGRGEMNVTLGIPRLREILMMASKNIKTPSMEIPFLDVPTLEEKAETLRKMLNRVSVADVLEKIDVSRELQWQPQRQYMYTLRFQFLPRRYYSQDYCIRPWMVIDHMKKKFFGEMFTAIRKLTKSSCTAVLIENEKTKKRGGRKSAETEEEGNDADDNANAERQGDQSSSEDEVEDEEDAKATNKFKQVHEDQEPEEEEKEVSDDDEEADADNEDTKATNKFEQVGEDQEPEEEEEKASDDDEETDAENEESQQQQPTEETAEQKPAIKKDKYTVSNSLKFTQNYREDGKKFLWCEIKFAFPLISQTVDLTNLLKETAAKSVLWETPHIKKAITYRKDNKLMLRTDGINIVEMFKYDALLDLEKLYCNDIHKMAETYGIEAASKIIVKEVKDVFNVYGIKVDPRHLSLIADYMTYNGTFEPLSRKGMESSVSPLQQISFESSLTFLKSATIRGKQDNLQNPSSSLMIGKPCETGTGCFTLLSSQTAAIH